MSVVLVLLLAVVVSGAVARMLPIGMPVPIVQIGFGACVSLTTHLRVNLDPDLFLLLFLPPLLFLDGWRIPKDELFKDLSTVVELALGLVLLTVLGVGFFIHWLIPTMPLPVAFALAAVVSPTDPIAVSAITARVTTPKRMMHILEGEALLNDASGLVCLRFAVAATATGSFAASQAALSFVWIATGGLLVGTVITLLATRVKAWVSEHFGEDTGSQILVSLLIPFGSYLLAEHLGCSGILASVAAGVTMTFAEVSRQALAITRMRRNSVWDTIQFAANGIIFVLLGEQLPGILEGAAETVRSTGHQEPWWLGLYVVAITVCLGTVRFAWVWTSFRLTLFRQREDNQQARRPHWRLVAAMSFAGVRGAITLAGVLTLPLVTSDGALFPARDMAIALAAGVIILSLMVASVMLPLLLRGLEMPAEPSVRAEENRTRVAAAEAAIRRIERVQHELASDRDDADVYASAGARIMSLYRERIESRTQVGQAALDARQYGQIDRELRLAGLEAERDAIFRLSREGLVGSEIARKLVREIDLIETRYHV